MSHCSLFLGDSLKVMKNIRDESVQMCVTSPPYFGLRDYGHSEQIGLESSVDEYVDRLVALFREVKRILRDNGTLWVNLGDSYANAGEKSQPHRDSPGGFSRATGERQKEYALAGGGFERACAVGDEIKTKDLLGVPWRVAFALQKDGWYLRQDIIWHKPNPMPESVRDRCTKAHEYLFLLSKSSRYYFDADAIKEESTNRSSGNKQRKLEKFRDMGAGLVGSSVPWEATEKRNRRSVWSIVPQPYKGAHFATFPMALVEPCVLAGSRPGDIVIDPFNGAGTTGLACARHGRRYIGIDINDDYLELTRQRLIPPVLLTTSSAVRNDMGLGVYFKTATSRILSL